MTEPCSEAGLSCKPTHGKGARGYASGSLVKIEKSAEIVAVV